MEPDNKKPQPDTDFGNEKFDSTPIGAGRLSGINEKIFALMRPKTKAIKQEPIGSLPPLELAKRTHLTNVPTGTHLEERIGVLITDPVLPEQNVQNGLYFPKKTLAEQVRDQLRFPILKSIPVAISGLALVIFAVGAYLLYSALPTRPDLILGIILVSAAGNVLMNR
jgi:hypothetical protein